MRRMIWKGRRDLFRSGFKENFATIDRQMIRCWASYTILPPATRTVIEPVPRHGRLFYLCLGSGPIGLIGRIASMVLCKCVQDTGQTSTSGPAARSTIRERVRAVARSGSARAGLIGCLCKRSIMAQKVRNAEFSYA